MSWKSFSSIVCITCRSFLTFCLVSFLLLSLWFPLFRYSATSPSSWDKAAGPLKQSLSTPFSGSLSKFSAARPQSTLPAKRFMPTLLLRMSSQLSPSSNARIFYLVKNVCAFIPSVKRSWSRIAVLSGSAPVSQGSHQIW